MCDRRRKIIIFTGILHRSREKRQEREPANEGRMENGTERERGGRVRREEEETREKKKRKKKKVE